MPVGGLFQITRKFAFFMGHLLKVKAVSRKRLIKEIVTAIGTSLLLGGIIAIPAATVLTLYFPAVDLVPVSGSFNYNFTQIQIVPPGQISFVGVYLNYGDSMVGAYSSNIRTNAYIMDASNFFNYIQGATFFTPISKSLPTAFSGFEYTASTPGFYYFVVENFSPYPALVTVGGATMFTIVVPTNSLNHTVSQLLLYTALIATLIGAVLYLPLRAWESRTSKKQAKAKAKKKKVAKKR
jgi:hypothetical protein